MQGYTGVSPKSGAIMKEPKYYGHDYMSKMARVLRYLKENGIASNRELNRICYRYGARIHDLRKDGWIIRSNLVDQKNGMWEFSLHGHVDQEKKSIIDRILKR